MNNIIVNPSDGFAYTLVDGKLQKISKYSILTCCDQSVNIYRIGNDIYHLNNHNHYLCIAKNAEFYPIDNSPSVADRQFALIKNTPLFVNHQSTGITELPDTKGYRKVFFPESVKTPAFVLTSCDKNNVIVYEQTDNLIGDDKEFFHKGKAYIQNCQGVYQKGNKAFFWNGAIYTLETSGCYKKSLMEMLVCNKDYIIAYTNTPSSPTFLITSQGNVKNIGYLMSLKRTEISTIMVTQQGDSIYLWSLTDKSIEEITHILSDESYDIGENGSITIFSKVDLGYDEGGIVDETILYKPDETGKYKKI
ncbi:MAG: hypothetical protein E7017_00250 [Alphaproteobacteria bacterium]|nr:hypothetical protein [Alphaproteobacteria bacterium]